MITHRKALVTLAIILGSAFTFHCSRNQPCNINVDWNKKIIMKCLKEDGSNFLMYLQKNLIKIDCDNFWPDIYLDVPLLTKNIKLLYLYECDLPTNNSLDEIIMRKLGVISVERLILQSHKNLSYTLVKHHLDDFKNLKYLILSGNNMSYVDKDLLAGLVKLTKLDLSKNNLSHLDVGFFNHTPGLQQIDLSNNILQSIQPGTFSNLKNLVLLNLRNNHLTELQSGIFDELVALKSLNLNMNYIVKIPKDLFAKLKNLESLYLFRNNFTHLPQNLLRYNTKLNTVTLSENKRNMTSLPNKLFAQLKKLKTLDLQKNGFISLPENLFWMKYTSLIFVYLQQNYLQTLPVQIFRDLKNLIYLNLSFNNLENLPNYIFKNTHKLQVLNLSKNRITSISNRLFRGLNNLIELNIEENQLTTISNQSFKLLRKLAIAKLSYNNLTLSQFFQYESPFFYCFALQELYLANNNIKQIFHDWTNNRSLRKLDLKHNNISRIDYRELLFESNNIKVDLTHNNIKYIHVVKSETFISYQKAIHNTIILVDGNPFDCNYCEFHSILSLIENRSIANVQNKIHVIPGNLTCQSPNEMKNVRITDLKSKSFTYTTNEDMCPKNCECLQRPEDFTLIFNCSHRNLTSVSSDIKIIDHSFPLELNFSGNRLTHMPDLKAMRLGSVRKLILSHNIITEISPNGLFSTIQILELHNNNISRIHPDVIQFLKQSMNLTRLTLHENPWECDCDAKDFLHFIQTKFATIPDLIKVMCLESNIPISEMIMIDFCILKTITIVGISIAISLIGLFVGIFGLYYKYQQQIKVWLFAHHWCLWFVTEEELDKEKLYDAFVSYSHKDEDFVVNELVSKLENGPKPFKLCLHYRDWLVGEWISANIVNSVENSKRTIVVLSSNFLESVWGRMEFRTAHCQALSEGRARVIIILYGDVGPIDDLDPELKAYISMNTYVKWGDPWFWNKLRYALPHQPNL